MLAQSYLVLSDSGGMPEEDPALGKLGLVRREVTERSEGLWAPTVKWEGPDRHPIFREIQDRLTNPASHQTMVQAWNP